MNRDLLRTAFHPRVPGRWMYALAALPVLCQAVLVPSLEAVAAQALCSLAVLGALVVARRRAVAARKLLRVLQRRAETDALTGLGNRRRLGSGMGNALRASERRREPLSLVFLDLDGFKAVNDALGHAEGDRVLCAVASALRAEVRAGLDEAYRVGGDEFVVLLRGTSGAGACRLAERLRAAVQAHPAVQGLRVPVGLSAGVATALPEESPDALVARADAALLRAKAAGKGCTVEDTVRPLRSRAA